MVEIDGDEGGGSDGGMSPPQIGRDTFAVPEASKQFTLR
jgi:hypothetical protein